MFSANDVSPSNDSEVDSAACYYSRFTDDRRLHERTVRGLRANKSADHLADPFRATLPTRARRTTTSPGGRQDAPDRRGPAGEVSAPEGRRGRIGVGSAPRYEGRACGGDQHPRERKGGSAPACREHGGSGRSRHGGGPHRGIRRRWWRRRQRRRPGVDGRPGARGRRAPDLLHLPTGACRRRSLPR